jgi:DNA adenine methylase
VTLFPGLGEPRPHDPVGAIKPLIKWVGGKTRVLPELVCRLPRAWRTYYEPFFGGGALFWHVEPPRAVLGDANADLMAMYQQVQDDPLGVSVYLQRFAQAHSRTFYLDMRDRWNAGLDCEPAERASMFLYLNRAGFNGLWRVNTAGHYNVPFGDGKRSAFPSAHTLLRTAGVLAGSHARLITAPFATTVSGVRAGDFVYFDPPYIPLSDTSSFVAYDRGGFDDACQRDLAEYALAHAEEGAFVMLSNSDTPRTRELYPEAAWRVDAIQVNRTVGADGAKRAPVGEVIITSRNYAFRG